MLRAEVVVGGQRLHVEPLQLERALLRHDRVIAVRGVDRERERQVAARARRRRPREVEVRARVGVDEVVHLDGRVRRRHERRRALVDLPQRLDALDEVAELLHRRHLRRRLPRLVERGAVVVRRVDDGCGQPAPARPAERHVDVLKLQPVRDVRQVVLALVAGAFANAHARVAGAAEQRVAPRVEPAAAELGGEARRARRRGRAARAPADPEVAPVGRRSRRAGVAARGARAAGITVERVEVRRARIAGNPEAVASLVVVEDRDGDAVGARLRVEVRHVLPADGTADVVRVLVLDLVEEHRAAAVRDLVPRDDRIDVRLPLVGVAHVRRVVRARAARRCREPRGEAACVRLGIDVRAGARDDVDADVVRDVEEPVEVAHAREVVDAGLRRVVAPVDVDRHGVVAVRLHLLEDVAPEARAWEPERMHLAGPDEQPLAVHEERVPVPRHGVRALGRARRYTSRREDGKHEGGQQASEDDDGSRSHSERVPEIPILTPAARADLLTQRECRPPIIRRFRLVSGGFHEAGQAHRCVRNARGSARRATADRSGHRARRRRR